MPGAEPRRLNDMKLTNIFPQIKTDKVQVKKSREVGPAAEPSPAAQATDRVELSAGTADAKKIREILQETPEVRAERVQALKERIDRGEYQVDSGKVADKLLKSLLQDNIAG
ncbi:MAG: flagellar biosynthesis anti-sigma factor FlgM [Thermodesulfobacteriota bacterium]